MTESNTSEPSKAPGFGAFLGSDSTSGSSTDNSTSDAKPKAASRSRRAPRQAADEDAPASSARRPKRAAKTERAADDADAGDAGSGDGGSRRRSGGGRRASARTTEDAPAETGGEERAAEVAGSDSGDDGEARPVRRKRSRGSRGGRRRRGRDEGEDSESNDNDDDVRAEGAETASDAGEEEETPRPRRAKRTRSKTTTRRRRGADEDEPEAEPAAARDDADDADSAEGDDEGETAKPRRKRSRGGRGRRKKTSADRDEADEGAEAPTESPRAATEDSDEDEDEAQRKRRRRGSRGGRKRKKTSTRDETPRAAVVEMIPGEEDDLPELPELPDEAELISGEDDDGEASGRGRKKKRSRRKRASSAAAADDDEVVEKRVRKRKEVVPDRQILVNAIDPEETRVAVVRDGMILDFQMTVDKDQSLVNDIYRGRIVNIEASIGAAFVDFGRGRNGFLHTSDVLPTYGEGEMPLSQILTTSIDPEDWDASSSQPSVTAELDEEDEDSDDSEEESDEGGEKDSRRGGRRGAKGGKGAKGRGRQAKGRQPRYRARPRRPISELFKVGQKVVVQITKDAIGDKGPTLTTYLSIPGRYLVLMPSISHRGVSRKIEDAKERKRLKKILDAADVPDGMGIIARTASMGHTKAEIKRDLDYLLGAWNRLAKRLDGGRGPTALYQESDVAIRTVRDLFGPETEAIVVDEPEALKNIREFAELLMPEQADRIKEHDGKRPLFHEMGVEQDFEKIFTRRIELPSGGSIVFDQAEALVAIDVNSGKTRTSSHDFEEIAHKTNMEAVPEIARQIRLRDLGGIIVVDFIDMMKNSNRRAVETAFRSCFAEDRARSKVGRISQFGLLEMTRQRLGPGMSKKLFRPCPACRGAGRARTDASRAAAIVRRLGSALSLKGFTKVEVRAHPETVDYLKRARGQELRDLEERSGRTLELVPVAEQLEDSVLRYLRADGREVRPGGRRKR